MTVATLKCTEMRRTKFVIGAGKAGWIDLLGMNLHSNNLVVSMNINIQSKINAICDSGFDDSWFMGAEDSVKLRMLTLLPRRVKIHDF